MIVRRRGGDGGGGKKRKGKRKRERDGMGWDGMGMNEMKRWSITVVIGNQVLKVLSEVSSG